MPFDVIDIPGASNPAQPAATVVLLRDMPSGPEVLMIRRGATATFGGMWAFPGGLIEERDIVPGDDAVATARRAAIREAREEVGLEIDVDSLVYWSHWLPPDTAPRRFSTWFFLAPAEAVHDAVIVDGFEADEHQWVAPVAALELQRRGEVGLLPPTLVTLAALARFADVAAAIAAADPVQYATRLATDAGGTMMCLWHGDVAYDGGDCDGPGPRHRLVMHDAGGWRFVDDRGRA